MKPIFKMELYRLFRRWEFYISLAIGAFLSIWLVVGSLPLLFHSMELLQGASAMEQAYYYPPSVFEQFIIMEVMHPAAQLFYTVLPLLVVLPFATTYAEDYNSGYIKNILTRTSRKHYYVAKFCVSCISGALVVGIVLLFSMFLTTMTMPQLMPHPSTFTFSVDSSNYLWFELYHNHPYLYILWYSLIDVVFYSGLTTLALAISSLIRNRFVALLTPIILVYSISSLLNNVGLANFAPDLIFRANQPVMHYTPMMLAGEILLVFAVGTVVFFLSRKVDRNVV